MTAGVSLVRETIGARSLLSSNQSKGVEKLQNKEMLLALGLTKKKDEFGSVRS